MSQPINLNKVRKERARAQKRARADQNAVRFGRNKAEKDAEKDQKTKTERFIDDHKREP